MARGKNLTTEQKKIIEHYVLVEKWTDKKISEHVGISIQSIERFRKKHGMTKGPEGNLSKQVIEAPKNAIKQVKHNDVEGGEKDKVQKLRNLFKGTARYKKLKDMLMPNQLEEFCDSWVDYQLQIEDMNPSEEDSLEIALIYKQRIDSNSKAFKECELQEQMFREQVGDRELNVENEADRIIFEMLNSNNRLKQEINKDLKDLTDKYNVVLRSMNATREQRESRTNVGADTFLSLVRTLTDRNKRKAVGLLNERIKMSTMAQTEKMKRAHEFADGTIDAILLSGDDYVNKGQKQ